MKPASGEIVEPEGNAKPATVPEQGRASRVQDMQPITGRFLAHVFLCLAIVGSAILVQFGQPDTTTAAVDDQQRIVYLDRDNNIWSARTDGSGARQLTTTGGYGNVSMTSDGTRILATAPYQGSTGVSLLSPDPEFPARSIAVGRLPVWSPDNSRFAFAQDGNVHIFTRDGDYQRTVEAPANVLEWSPNGRHIGFGRNLIDHYGSGCPIRQLGWVDADSGSVQTAGTMVGGFAWSGDGDSILHVSAVDGAIRQQSVTGGGNSVLTNTLVNPCGAPFFTTEDGARLIGARSVGERHATLVVIDQQTGEDRIYNDVPIGFPASRLPVAYLTGDSSGRYLNLVRSFPTDVHRMDLQTGNIQPVLTNDWRRVVGFAAEGNYFALLNTPSGQAHEMTIRGVDGSSHMLSDVGWIGWQPSPVNTSAVLAWQRNWAREDRPVAAGEARTWLWGPEPFDTRPEEYVETPGGYRAVRYFDKSRMEITHPAGDRSSDWYVTNGLLVRELITGQMQVGDSSFIERNPATVPVAGDVNDPNSPTYATLQPLLDAPAVEVGSEITATLDRAGNVGNDGPGGVQAVHFVEQTNHTIADVFWDYLNSTGMIWDGEGFVEGRLFQPTFFATGLPITEAYWSTVRVGGEDMEVLMQCFERRCLTYTPDNPEGWQVEMGNVGRHYHAWRYQ